jgi:predicted  nucleic acid-binding Zn-ribbon protein
MVTHSEKLDIIHTWMEHGITPEDAESMFDTFFDADEVTDDLTDDIALLKAEVEKAKKQVKVFETHICELSAKLDAMSAPKWKTHTNLVEFIEHRSKLNELIRESSDAIDTMTRYLKEVQQAQTSAFKEFVNFDGTLRITGCPRELRR